MRRNVIVGAKIEWTGLPLLKTKKSLGSIWRSH